jgi:hypothetical protein
MTQIAPEALELLLKDLCEKHSEVKCVVDYLSAANAESLIANAGNSDVFDYVLAIHNEIERESPNQMFLLQTKQLLAEFLGNIEVMRAVENELATLCAYEDGLLGNADEEGWSIGQATWDPDEKSTPYE